MNEKDSSPESTEETTPAKISENAGEPALTEDSGVSEAPDAEKKKEKKKFEDDGRTSVDMNVEGFSWYRPHSDGKRKKKAKDDPDRPTAKETRAMILAAYKAYLPYLLIILGSMVIVAALAFLWLR